MMEKWENMKDKIYPKIINHKSNLKMLKEVPYIEWMDLAVVFVYSFGKDMRSPKNIDIRSKHVKAWGIDCQTLYKKAVQNAVRDMPAQVINTRKTMALLMQDDQMPDIYILTNNNVINGATCLLYPGLLKKIAREKIKGDFYIIPCDVHECILVPANEIYSKQEMQEALKEINENYAHPRERLSDEVYRYNFKTESITY